MPQTSTPLISIVMPTRNREKFIVETIKSIQNQTYTNWELLIMDDGSDDYTDKTVKRLQESDSRIQYHNNGIKRIVGKLKNKGIELSKGEYIAFMDSDDLWPPQKLAKQLEALLLYPDAGFSFTNGQNFQDADKSTEPPYYKKESGHICANFFKSICKGEVGVFSPTLLIKKTCLTTENLFRTDRLFTDFSFITNLAQQYSGVIVYDVLLQRRIHKGNSYSTNWIADYQEHSETIKRYKQEHKLDAAFADTVLYTTYIHWGHGYMERGMKKEARQAYKTAWSYNRKSIIPFKKIAKTILKRS
ncbi:MAG: glycosyltransferase [Bacteroidetes bacterium]|nr:glycosyltransferase [Bacteroidota bacterium]